MFPAHFHDFFLFLQLFFTNFQDFREDFVVLKIVFFPNSFSEFKIEFRRKPTVRAENLFFSASQYS